MNWLARARREILESARQPTAKTAKTQVSAVMAVPHPGFREKLEGSIGSFGSTPSGDFAKIEAAIHRHKPELLAELAGKINRWRVTHADGRITEHSSRGLTEAEALDLARLFGEPVRAEPVEVDPPSPPADLGVLPPQARRPERVCCGECLHFDRDAIGDGAGIGLCKIGGEGSPGVSVAERQTALRGF